MIDISTYFDKKCLGKYTIKITNIKPGLISDILNFELYLQNSNRELSKKPIIKCSFFKGRKNYYPWVDFYYYPQTSFLNNPVNINNEKLNETLFQFISNLIPDGGHMMVVYLNHIETNLGLQKGVPPPITELGYLLWNVGCTWFKDWYFSEGFREGDVKLQGEKPLNKTIQKEHLLHTYNVVYKFYNTQNSDDQIILNAKKRAKLLLSKLDTK